MRARIVTGTVPAADGTVDYTHADITTWDTKGVAYVFVSGNSALESDSGRISIGFTDQTGEQHMVASRLLKDRPTVSDDLSAIHSDSVARIMDDNPAPGAGSWARATYSDALSNGVQLTWDVDATALATRTFNVVVVLIDGLTDSEIGTGSGSGIGFEPDAVLAMGFAGSANAFGGVNNNGQVTLGGAVDGVSIKQAAIVTAWDTASDNESAGIARDDVYALDFDPPATETEQVLTDFTATGFDDTGLGGHFWTAFLPDDGEPFGVALEELSGTGAQSFTGLGISSQVVIGLINGCTTTNAIENDTDQLSTTGLFVTDGTNTYSMSLAQTREAIGTPGGNLSDCFSRYTSGSINVLSHTGGTLFAATVTGVSGGLQLNITTGITGRMFLFGFGQGDALLVADDTEQITDGVVLMGARALVVSETVHILDGAVSFTNEIVLGADPQGTTLDAAAARGTALQGGAVAGTVLG